MHPYRLDQRFQVIALAIVLFWIFLTASAPATQLGFNLSVNGQSGPWNWVAGGLNTNYQYGINNQLPPMVISGNNGFDFTAGNTLSISYVSGAVSAQVATFPYTDANGYSAFLANNTSSPQYGFFPSLYINPSQYPVNLTGLVGTFADSSGAIVGVPFNVGDSASLTIPLGATSLQLGANDTYFADNGGSWQINVTGKALPQATLFSVSRTVNAQSGPWQYTAGGLNTNYQYGANDQLAPLVIGAKDGFNFAPGSILDIGYVSGTVSAEAGTFPYTDANGDTSYLANKSSNPQSGFFPSLYFNQSQYPAYLTEMVGTFADSSGTIVGAPFNIGDSAALTVPAGATQLQIGANDTLYADNSGSWQIQVSEVLLPEPISIWVALVFAVTLMTSRTSRRSGRDFV